MSARFKLSQFFPLEDFFLFGSIFPANFFILFTHFYLSGKYEYTFSWLRSFFLSLSLSPQKRIIRNSFIFEQIRMAKFWLVSRKVNFSNNKFGYLSLFFFFFFFWLLQSWQAVEWQTLIFLFVFYPKSPIEDYTMFGIKEKKVKAIIKNGNTRSENIYIRKRKGEKSL